ncbi:hypothetical protein Ciccas_005825, partial [Cichlidogyrus casuarinus]
MPDQRGNTALHKAAICGHVAMVECLSENGADIRSINSKKWIPLDCAAAFGHYKVVKSLVQRGSNVNFQDRSKRKLPAIHLACMNGHAEVVKFLLKFGADPCLTVCVQNPKITNGSNALDIAIEKGRLRCAQAILKSHFWENALKNRVISKSGTFDTPFRKAVRLMPELAAEILNKFVEVNDVHQDDENLTVRYDFQYIEDSYANWFSADVDLSLVSDKSVSKVMKRLNGKNLHRKIHQEDKNKDIYDEESGDLLKDARPYIEDRFLLKTNHPLAVLSNPPYKFTYDGKEFQPLKEMCPKILEERKVVYDPDALRTKYLIFLMSSLRLLVEIVQFVEEGVRHLEAGTVLEIFLHIFAILVLVDFDDCSASTGIRRDWQWQLGACAMFLAWMVLLLFIRKIPHTGIYIILFLKVCRTFIRFSVIYGLFLLAFAMTWNVLVGNHDYFST